MNIYSNKEIRKIEKSGQVLAEARKAVLREAKEGVSLNDLDKLAHKIIIDAGCKPAFLGYKSSPSEPAYPATICASVNDVIVHSPPTSYRLKKGDIFTVDVGVIFDGFYSDSAWTIGIGRISKEAEELLKVGSKCLSKAISTAIPGKTLGDIGHAVKSTAEKAKFHVVKGLTGHGIGKKLHEEPKVMNEGKPGEGIEIVPGMVIAIEPMIAIGTPHLEQTKNGGYKTVDGSLSAHFEHTVAITRSGPVVLTK